MLTQQATTTNAGSTNLLKFVFGHDQQGRVISSTPTTNSTTLNTDNYGYDNTNRVNSGPIVGTSGSTAYNYTTAGGIIASTNTFATAGYSPSGQLCWTSTTTGSSGCSATPSPRTTYSYNADGERTAVTPPSGGNPESLGWSTSSQRLLCVNTNGTTCSTSSPTSTTTVYTYNGEGLRATSTNQSVTNNFTWNLGADGQLLADSNWDYLYNGSVAPFMQIGTGSSAPTDSLVQDQNLNTRGIVQLAGGTTSYNGQLINYTDYDAYGNPETLSGGIPQTGGLTVTSGGYALSASTYGFGAGTLDQSGLIYLVNRYYDANSGQFVTIDPALSTTKKPYSYSSNNPIGNSDPLGLWTEGWCLSIQLAAGLIFQGSDTLCLQESNGNQEVGWTLSLPFRPFGGLTVDNLFSASVRKTFRGLNLIKAVTKSLNPSLSAGAYVGYEISNCDHIRCLGGVFTDWTASVGDGLAGTSTYFNGSGGTKGIFTGIGIGEGITIGQTQSFTKWGLFTGANRTWAQQILTFMNTGGDYGAWQCFSPASATIAAGIWAMRSIERGLLS
jgi:RHS repeat-associated protein